MKHLLYVVFIVGFVVSCGPTSNKETSTTKDTAALNVDLHRLPELRTVDSIDMHFFPDINDQKIYTRMGTNDTAFIHLITMSEINNAFVDQTSCEYDTKFFCFSKGQIVKTLYVAALKDSCRFIGFIKSGGVAVRARLSDSAASMVNSWRNKTAK